MTNRVLILSIFAATSTASLFAQEPIKLKLDIPFSFHVGTTPMPTIGLTMGVDDGVDPLYIDVP